MRYLVFITMLLSSISAQSQVRCDDLFPSDRKKFSLPEDHETIVFKGATRKEKLPANRVINLFVWNIYKAREKGFWVDFKRLQQKADISLIQETILNPQQCANFESLTHMSWATSISFWQEPHTATGVTNGSRYMFSEHDFIRSPKREPFINTPKMASYSKLPIKGSTQELIVVSIHGLNFTPTGHLEKQLSGIADRVKNHEGPLIVGGDYNTRNEARMKVLSAFAERLNLKILELENDQREEEDKLDHILVRGFKVRRAKIIEEAKSSDHPALWAELQIEK